MPKPLRIISLLVSCSIFFGLPVSVSEAGRSIFVAALYFGAADSMIFAMMLVFLGGKTLVRAIENRSESPSGASGGRK